VVVLFVNPNSKIDEEGELRTDLINLLERSQEHLTPKQSSEVKHLLKEYEGLFAASDSDYGRTNVVKHKIATRSYRINDQMSHQCVVMGRHH
jgi:hypothetical protein